MTPAKRTKAWRQANKSRVKTYEKKRYSKTHSRIKARRELIKRHGVSKLKGKSVDHANGNALDNRASNLRIVHKYHKNLKSGKLNKARRR